MTIWKHRLTIDRLNAHCKNTMMEHVKLEFTEVGDNYLIARLPVNHTTHQPYGYLHGGASVMLAETISSMAAWMVVGEDQRVMGMEINANHLKGVQTGFVFGKCLPVHLGKRSHVWKTEITNESNELVCISRITMIVL